MVTNSYQNSQLTTSFCCRFINVNLFGFVLIVVLCVMVWVNMKRSACWLPPLILDNPCGTNLETFLISIWTLWCLSGYSHSVDYVGKRLGEIQLLLSGWKSASIPNFPHVIWGELNGRWSGVRDTKIRLCWNLCRRENSVILFSW